MKDFQNWRKEKNLDEYTEHTVSQDHFLRICQEYFSASICGSMKTYHEHRHENLIESVETSRYAIEVNYRTNKKEALEGFAKICLGYVSAALKKYGYHTKHVFTEKPLRLLVSSRNWDNGEWIGMVTWNHERNCFVLSKGFYNKDRKTVSIQSSKECTADTAADITKELHNTMHHLKGQPDRNIPNLRPVPLKRGPKQ
jgi:hypothetical protein